VNKSVPRCDRDGMCTIAPPQLSKDVRHVGLDGVLGDKQPLCDIAIPISLSNLAQNVELAVRERFVAEMLGEVGRDFGKDDLYQAMALRA
jgi:hypothetical protein